MTAPDGPATPPEGEGPDPATGDPHSANQRPEPGPDAPGPEPAASVHRATAVLTEFSQAAGPGSGAAPAAAGVLVRHLAWLESELDATRAALAAGQCWPARGVLVQTAAGELRTYREATGFHRDRFGACHVTATGGHPRAVFAEGHWALAEFTPALAPPATTTTEDT